MKQSELEAWYLVTRCWTLLATFLINSSRLNYLPQNVWRGPPKLKENNSIAPSATLGRSDVLSLDLLIRFSLGYLWLDMNYFVQDLSS